MGKLTGIIGKAKNVEKTVHRSEWISQITMLVLVILCVATLPFVSDMVVSPYLMDAFGVFGYQILYAMYQYGLLAAPLTMDGIYVCILCLIVIAIILLAGVGKKNKQKHADIYLAGASLNNDERLYLGSMGEKVEATSKNMYLNDIFGEKSLAPFGSVLNIILFALAGIASVVMMFGLIPGLA